MSWIKTISYEEAKGKLKRLYDRVKGPNNNVDNVLKIHSLRPHTLNGHMVLYKSVLHNNRNTFPKWYLEVLGTYVSSLNHCEYCFDHHAQGIKKNLNDEFQFEDILAAIENDDLTDLFSAKMTAGCDYARMLTLDHTSITEDTINELRANGLDDGEILEINQVVSYFNYVNRMVVGLGVNTDGDILGLSPGNSDDAENWTHE
ncbi:MAG: peroxidase-related enzyme [Bacteroidota bacterium]